MSKYIPHRLTALSIKVEHVRMTRIYAYLVLASVLIINVESMNVLAIFHNPLKSHHSIFTPVIEDLAKRGHNVTLVSHQKKMESSLQNIDYVELPFEEMEQEVNVTETKWAYFFRIYNMMRFAKKSVRLCENLIKDPRLKNLISENTKGFDVVLFEYFNNDCPLNFVHKLKIPSVAICSTILFPWHYNRLGLTWNSHVYPNPSLPHGIRPSVIEKLENLGSRFLWNFIHERWSQVPTREMIERITGESLPPFEDIGRNVSLVLVNSHPLLRGSPPASANVLDIGGIHMQSEQTPLSMKLQEYIESSSHGVILFSFGSLIRADSISKQKTIAFRDAFATLEPIRFIWKGENTTHFTNNSNILAEKWLPQMEILCHNNVKAFITHGGMKSTIEVLHCGVPVLVIPFFADQYTNAKALEDLGLGKILYYNDVTNDTLVDSLRTILQPEFKEAAARASRLFKDKLTSPSDLASYWIEHVQRNGGAHLRPSMADVSFYQFYHLDLILTTILLVIVLVIVVRTKTVLRKLRLLCKKKKE